MSDFPNGYYYITSVDTGTAVNRHPIEDRSLLPKRILALPTNVEPVGPWLFEKNDKGYSLKALGAPAGQRSGLIYAYLIGQDSASNWTISKEQLDGKTVSTIQEVGSSKYWTTDTEDSGWGRQIGLTSEPSFTKTKAFIIESAD